MNSFSAYALSHTSMSQWHRSLDIKQASNINIIKGLQFSQSWFILDNGLSKGASHASYVRGGNAYTCGSCQEAQAVRANGFASASSRRYSRHQDSWLVAYRQPGVSGLLERAEETAKKRLGVIPQKHVDPPRAAILKGGP